MQVQCLFTELLIWRDVKITPSYIRLRMRGAMPPLPILLVWLFIGIRKYYLYFNHPHLGDGCTFHFRSNSGMPCQTAVSTVPTVYVLVQYFITILIAHCEYLNMCTVRGGGKGVSAKFVPFTKYEVLCSFVV